MVETAFRKSTIAELIMEPARSKPLCDFPNCAGSSQLTIGEDSINGCAEFHLFWVICHGGLHT